MSVTHWRTVSVETFKVLDTDFKSTVKFVQPTRKAAEAAQEEVA